MNFILVNNTKLVNVDAIKNICLVTESNEILITEEIYTLDGDIHNLSLIVCKDCR